VSWPEISLMDVCDIEGGTQPPKETFRYEPTDGFVRMLQIQDFKTNERAVYIPKTARMKMCEEDDVLIARYGASIGRILRGKAGAYNVALVKTIPDRARLHGGFFFHLLSGSGFQQFVTNIGSRAAQAGFNKSDLSRFTFVLPPLAEQKRIAGILDAADALRTKRREALAQLDTLLQSTFLDLFGDPVTNPKGWQRVLLGELTTIDAPMVDPRKSEYRDLLHYGPDRIEKDSGELLPALRAEEDNLISGKFVCVPGEVLYSKIRPYLNKVALVQERCLCSADVYPVAPKLKVLGREYLWAMLRGTGFLDYVAGFSQRTNIPKLNRKQFAGYPAPVPPLELQHHFGKVVMLMEKQKTAQRNYLAELDALFASLQSRAFRGEL
jgi:type I restriction enzyme S subunit